MNNVANNIQAILFAVAETKTVAELAKILDVSVEDITKGLEDLDQILDNSALVLVRNGHDVTLATRSEHSALLETLRKEELSKELSKASAETLSVVAYYPGVSKAQIEFIRGVNVSYSLRALQMRGLVELRGAGRTSGYFPTTQLIEHFGVETLEGLPNYIESHAKIKALLAEEESTQQ